MEHHNGRNRNPPDRRQRRTGAEVRRRHPERPGAEGRERQRRRPRPHVRLRHHLLHRNGPLLRLPNQDKAHRERQQRHHRVPQLKRRDASRRQHSHFGVRPRPGGGSNVVKVKVKVTAEDVTTTETYTLRIRRAATDELISNLGQGTLPGEPVSTTSPKIAAQFTTGSNPGGYNISAVKLKLSMPSGTTPQISIYSNKKVISTSHPTFQEAV